MRHYSLIMQPVRLSSKDSILEAAFVVFSRDAGASLAEVAMQAGVGRATLHRHFSSRDDLVKTLALLAIEEMDAAVEEACADAQSATDVLRLSLAALIPLGDRHGFITQHPIESDSEIAQQFREADDATRAMVEAAQGEGLFDSAVSAHWITHVYNALLFAGWESVKQGETTPQQAADLAWRSLTSGLGAAKK